MVIQAFPRNIRKQIKITLKTLNFSIEENIVKHSFVLLSFLVVWVFKIIKLSCTGCTYILFRLINF